MFCLICLSRNHIWSQCTAKPSYKTQFAFMDKTFEYTTEMSLIDMTGIFFNKDRSVGDFMTIASKDEDEVFHYANFMIQSFFHEWMTKDCCLGSAMGKIPVDFKHCDTDHFGFSMFLSELHNRLMHALNGNIDADEYEEMNYWDQFREQFDEEDRLDDLWEQQERESWYYTLQFIDFEYKNECEIRADWMNDFWSGILALCRNKLMHALNGNTDQEFEEVMASKKILDGCAKLADYVVLKNCSTKRLVELFGSVAESRRYEAFQNYLNKPVKRRDEVMKIKIKKQRIYEEVNSRFQDLELTGELADARDVYNYNMKPSMRSFTLKQYKRLLRTLFLLESKEGSKTQGPKEAMDRIMGFIGNVKGHVKLMTGVILNHEQIFDEIRKVMSYIPSAASIAAVITTFVGDVIACVSLEGPKLYAFFATRFVAFGLSIGEKFLDLRKSLSTVLSFFEEQIKGKDDAKDKVQNSNEHIGVAVFKLIGHMLFNWGDVKLSESRAKRISALFSSMNTLHTFMTKFTEPFKEMVNHLTESTFGVLLFDVVPLEFARELRIIGQKIGTFLQMNLTSMDVVMAQEIVSLFKEATECYTQLAGIEGHHWVTWIDQYKMFKSFVVAQANMVMATQLVRPEPLGLYFYGPPGTGKTAFVRRMSTDACAMFFNKEVIGSPVYEKPQTSVYFEGYFKEFCTMVDEFLMSTDKEINHANGSFVIAANSTAACPLDMAFDRKGEAHYESRITATAGNSPDPRWTECGHVSYGALARRLVCVDMKPLAERGYDVNLGKWTKDLGQVDPAKDYEFEVWDYRANANSTPSRNTCLCRGTYKDFVHWVLKELVKRDDAFILSSYQNQKTGFERAMLNLEGVENVSDASKAFAMSYNDGLKKLQKYGEDHPFYRHYVAKERLRILLYGIGSESSPVSKVQMDVVRKLFSPKKEHGLSLSLKKAPEKITTSKILQDMFAEYCAMIFELHDLYETGYDVGILLYQLWAEIDPGCALIDLVDKETPGLVNYHKLLPDISDKFLNEYGDKPSQAMERLMAVRREYESMKKGKHSDYYESVVGLPAYMRYARWVQEQADAFASAVYQHWKLIALAVLGVFGAVAACWALFYPSEEESEIPQLLYEHNMPKAPARRRNLTKVFSAKTQVSDPTLLEQSRVVSNAFGKMRVTTTLPDADPYIVTGTVFNICGTCIVTTLHMWAGAIGEAETESEINKLKPYTNLSLWIGGVYIENIPFLQCKMVPWVSDEVELDLCTIIIPLRFMSAGRDLREYFLEEKEFDDRVEHNVVRVRAMDPTEHLAGVFVERAGSGRYRYVNKLTGKGTNDPLHAEDDRSNCVFTTTHCVEYSIKSVAGDCMSLYALDNSLAKHKFVGAHVAGRSSTFGSCAIMSREYIREFVDPFYHQGVERQAVTQGDLIDLGGTNKPLILGPIEDSVYLKQIPAQSKVLGRVDKKFLNYMNRETSIFRTRLFHGEHCHRRPAALRKVGGVDPLDLGLAREVDVDYRSDDPVIDIAWRRYNKIFDSIEVGVPGLLTLKEAINRHVSSEHLQTVRQGTSAGALLKQNGGGEVGKRAYVYEIPPVSGEEFMAFAATEKFVEAVGAFEAEMEKGRVPMVPYLITMKDELRDNEKVDDLKTRLFKAGSLGHYVVEKRYCGAFHEAIRSDPWLTYNMVGVNMNGKFGERLLEVVSNGRPILWDIRNNDNTRHRDGKWRFNQMKMKFLRRVDLAEQRRHGFPSGELLRRDRVRACLEEYNQSPIFQIGDILYQKGFFVASGDPQTFDQNSGMNKVETDACVLYIIRENAPAVFDEVVRSMDFDKYWWSGHAGDDAIATILDERLECVTYDAIKQAMWKLFHTEITPPSKGRYHKVMTNGKFDPTLEKVVESDEPESSLEAINFLGRTPAKFMKRFTCWRLNESTIHAIPFWRLKSHIGESEMETQLCDQALMEWFYYGEEVFTYWKNKYDAELLRVGAKASSLTWQKMLGDWSAAQC